MIEITANGAGTVTLAQAGWSLSIGGEELERLGAAIASLQEALEANQGAGAEEEADSPGADRVTAGD
jgi:hypothetical protein